MRKLTLKLLLIGIMLMPAILTFGQTEILNEAFDESLMPPTGWTIEAGPGLLQISTGTHAGGVAPQGYIYGWPQSVGTTRLISPVLDVSSYTTLELDFKHTVNSATYGNFSLKVETTSDGGTTWNEVFSISPTGYFGGTPVNVPITNADFGSATFQFCYTYETTAIQAIYHAYFDDFVLSGEEVVTCFPPTDLAAANITTSGADLSWIPAGSESLWNLEYGVEGFTPGAGTPVNGLTIASYSISGLDQGISYELLCTGQLRRRRFKCICWPLYFYHLMYCCGSSGLVRRI